MIFSFILLSRNQFATKLKLGFFISFEIRTILKFNCNWKSLKCWGVGSRYESNIVTLKVISNMQFFFLEFDICFYHNSKAVLINENIRFVDDTEFQVVRRRGTESDFEFCIWWWPFGWHKQTPHSLLYLIEM